MKTLYILRHAKSSWPDTSLADFDRPLNERGLSAAPFIGEMMARQGIQPEVIISSPAKRAIHTAELVKEASGSNTPVRYEERIYEASPQALKLVVAQIGEEFDSAMIVGHNPGIEGLIKYLTDRSERMPTASLAAISLDVGGWNEITAGSGELLFLIRPREEMKANGYPGQ
jgi:phosphohistidine phosphatase